ncbi:50S ribosomal protein L1 [Methanimicrococcus hongohii]|uniref:Large ribosomal subunit protein uL1 n=1 Tax=Methanimicrococcus hongohii TaxID=3028295 RepID=A0AA96ZTU0_9EURY|nr:50S ribosomal protein L1 [Methanimicrococcus sp. Hf6]WNY23586.1 50S ribosomal protein L1 [Methanimicrococcus sp. Hf6]
MADVAIEELVKKLLEESPQRKFSESVDLAINLKNLDLNQPKNRVDEEIVLPNGLGKELKVGVFAKGEVALQAKQAGAAYVFDDADIQEMKDDKARAKSVADECDFFIAETQFMATIGKTIGTVLGPRGKMPVPLLPGKSIGEMIQSKQSAVRVRSKDKMTFHVTVGRRDMPSEQLAQNIDAVISRVERALVKGKHNIKSIYVTTTMGKSERVM